MRTSRGGDPIAAANGVSEAAAGCVGVSGLDGIFIDGVGQEKLSRVDAAADELEERFGQSALRRGNSLRGEGPRKL